MAVVVVVVVVAVAVVVVVVVVVALVVVVVVLLLLLMIKLLANALSKNQGESIKKKTIVFLPDYPRRSPHESKLVPSVALVHAKVWGWHISGIQ